MGDADKGLGAGFKPVCHLIWKRTGAVLMIFCHLYKKSDRLNNSAFATIVKTLDNLGFKLNIELKHAS
jgi:hypothetical protein